jgi:cell wall-associated NlpC family hydrolase
VSFTRQQVVATAREWIGVPYRHQGRSRQCVDCIGFVVCVGAQLGVTIEAPYDYTDSPSGKMLMDRSRVQFDEVLDRKTPIPGDIMALWGWNRNEPQHFAIAADFGSRPTMIHAFSKRKQVVEHGIDPFWEKRLMALFTFKGMEG